MLFAFEIGQKFGQTHTNKFEAKQRRRSENIKQEKYSRFEWA